MSYVGRKSTLVYCCAFLGSFFCLMSSVHGITYNQLKAFRQLRRRDNVTHKPLVDDWVKRQQDLVDGSRAEGEVQDPGSQLVNCFFNVFGVKELNELVSVASQLKADLVEAECFIAHISGVVDAETACLSPLDHMNTKNYNFSFDENVMPNRLSGFTSAGGLSPLTDEYERLLMRLFNLLGVDSLKDVAGAIYQLREEWLEAREALRALADFAQKNSEK